MKKYRDTDFWFELTEGSAPSGLGFVRYYAVTCRKCGKQARHMASGQANDQLRKFFIRQNWEIGRATNLHLCPDCTVRHKHRLRPEPPTSNLIPLLPPQHQRVTLQEAWKQANEIERAEFLLQLRDANGPIFTRDKPPAEPHTLEPAVDEPIADDNGEPADWWLELQKIGANHG